MRLIIRKINTTGRFIISKESFVQTLIVSMTELLIPTTVVTLLITYTNYFGQSWIVEAFVVGLLLTKVVEFLFLRKTAYKSTTEEVMEELKSEFNQKV